MIALTYRLHEAGQIKGKVTITKGGWGWVVCGSSVGLVGGLWKAGRGALGSIRRGLSSQDPSQHRPPTPASSSPQHRPPTPTSSSPRRWETTWGSRPVSRWVGQSRSKRAEHGQARWWKSQIQATRRNGICTIPRAWGSILVVLTNKLLHKGMSQVLIPCLVSLIFYLNNNSKTKIFYEWNMGLFWENHL